MPEPDLRQYLRVLRRRVRLIAVVTAAAMALAVVASLVQHDVYAAKAQVLLQPRSTESLFDPTSGQRLDPTRSAQTEIEVLKSLPVKRQVRSQLGPVPPVSANSVGQTDLINVTVRSTDPKRAAAAATAYAKAYIDFRRQQTVDDLLAAADQIQKKVTSLQRDINASTGPDRDSLVQQLGVFRQKLDELQVDTQLKQGGAQLVSDAPVPQTPVSPKPARYALVALLLGAALGVGLSLFLEYLDDSVKNEDDIRRVAPELGVIGLIPAVPTWKDRADARLVSIDEPTSPVAEAYRTLRTSVQFYALQRPVSTILVTSANAQEGKTTTIANLGVVLARAGRRVAVVCCDLRRPRLHEFFGLSNAVGFTSVLLGEATIDQALQPVPGVERLSVLASGPLPPNPSELLATRLTSDLLARLREKGYTVIVDCPPVLPVTDALVLSPEVDAVLLVAVAGTTSRRELGKAWAMLRNVGAPVAGAVLNGVSEPGSYGYGYGYYNDPSGGRANGGRANGRGVKRSPLAKGGQSGDQGRPPSRSAVRSPGPAVGGRGRSPRGN